MTARAAAGGDPATDRESYVTSMLAKLYPPPLRVESGRRVKAPDTRATFLLLPHRRPHIVIAAGHARESARAVHRQLTGPRLRTRLARSLFSVALASGAADLLSRGRLTISGPAAAESVDTILAELTGVDKVLITMPVGPARANRKPVLQVTDLAGKVLAFVKVGHNSLTSGLVQAEAIALDRVAKAGLHYTRAPVVLAELSWRDLHLLVLEPLPVAPREMSAVRNQQALLMVVREIVALSSWQGEWSDNPYSARLRTELGASGSPTAALLSALDRIDSQAPAIALGSWHGDLNPGNIAVLPDEVLVWDWERFDDQVPVGFDLLHHSLQQAITVNDAEPKAAAGKLLDSASELLGKLGVAAREADATTRLYLLALAARYLRDDQARAGAPLGSVQDWILPALTTVAPP